MTGLEINLVYCNDCGAEIKVLGEVSEDKVPCPECSWKAMNRWWVCSDAECGEEVLVLPGSYYDSGTVLDDEFACPECGKPMNKWVDIELGNAKVK